MSSQSPIVVKHRYPWSKEERIIIGVLFALPVAIWAMTFTGVFNSVVGATLATVASWAGALWLIRLGRTRKNRSAVEATLDGNTLVAKGFGLDEKKNRIDITTVREIDARDFGATRAFTLSGQGDDKKFMTFPARVARDPKLRPLLDDLFKQSAYITRAARELRDTL